MLDDRVAPYCFILTLPRGPSRDVRFYRPDTVRVDRSGPSCLISIQRRFVSISLSLSLSVCVCSSLHSFPGKANKKRNRKTEMVSMASLQPTLPVKCRLIFFFDLFHQSGAGSLLELENPPPTLFEPMKPTLLEMITIFFLPKSVCLELV